LFEFEVLANKIPKVEVAMKYMWFKRKSSECWPNGAFQIVSSLNELKRRVN
jgi:hypothetical protein